MVQPGERSTEGLCVVLGRAPVAAGRCFLLVSVGLAAYWLSGVSMSSARRCSSKAVTVQMSLGSSDFLRISGRSRRCSFWIWTRGERFKQTAQRRETSTHSSGSALPGPPDLCGFFLYGFLQHVDVAKRGPVCLHVHRSVWTRRVVVHQKLCREGSRNESAV